MKRIIPILIISLLFTPLAQAATFFSEYGNILSQNFTREIAPITITAESDGEITAEHGINILLDYDRYILWDKNQASASGSAADNARLPFSFMPEFLDGYKVIHIPVESDWMADESVVLTGLRMRTYDREVGQRFLGLDLDGDKLADFNDINSYRVDTATHTDQTIPYPIENLAYTVNEDKTEIHITWTNPPDYDLVSTRLERTLTRNGVVGLTEDMITSRLAVEFIDIDIQPTDQVTYRIVARDRRNDGEMTELTIDLSTYEPPAEEPTEEPPAEEPSEPEPTPDVDNDDPEVVELNRLYTYYQVRHEIKCLSANANPSNSVCLWAKIDLVYTQEKTGQSDVDASLSDRDLYLMALRVKWPQSRYQTKCVEAETPDKTCPALEKSLQRIHYFID